MPGGLLGKVWVFCLLQADILIWRRRTTSICPPPRASLSVVPPLWLLEKVLNGDESFSIRAAEEMRVICDSSCFSLLLPQLRTPVTLLQRMGGGKNKKVLERARELEQRGIKKQLLERLILLFDPLSWELSFSGRAGRGKAPNSRHCASL